MDTDDATLRIPAFRDLFDRARRGEHLPDELTDAIVSSSSPAGMTPTDHDAKQDPTGTSSAPSGDR